MSAPSLPSSASAAQPASTDAVAHRMFKLSRNLRATKLGLWNANSTTGKTTSDSIVQMRNCFITLRFSLSTWLESLPEPGMLPAQAALGLAQLRTRIEEVNEASSESRTTFEKHPDRHNQGLWSNATNPEVIKSYNNFVGVFNKAIETEAKRCELLAEFALLHAVYKSLDDANRAMKARSQQSRTDGKPTLPYFWREAKFGKPVSCNSEISLAEATGAERAPTLHTFGAKTRQGAGTAGGVLARLAISLAGDDGHLDMARTFLKDWRSTFSTLFSQQSSGSQGTEEQRKRWDFFKKRLEAGLQGNTSAAPGT